MAPEWRLRDTRRSMPRRECRAYFSTIYSGFTVMIVREQVPLAPLTTLVVGGPARYFAEAHAESEVHEAVEFARSRDLALFVLGGGINLLLAHSGFTGLRLY